MIKQLLIEFFGDLNIEFIDVEKYVQVIVFNLCGCSGWLIVCIIIVVNILIMIQYDMRCFIMFELGGDMFLWVFWVIICCEYDFICLFFCLEGFNDDIYGIVLYIV